MRIEGPIALAQNVAFADLVAIAELGDSKRGLINDGATWFVEPKFTHMIPIELIVPWLANGGSVPSTSGYAAYILMSAATYKGEVLDGVSNRLRDAAAINWSKWKSGDNYSHYAANAGVYTDQKGNTFTVEAGDMIVPGTSWGYQLPAPELSLIYQATGYTVLSRDQFQIDGLIGQ